VEGRGGRGRDDAIGERLTGEEMDRAELNIEDRPNVDRRLERRRNGLLARGWPEIERDDRRV